ncbi:hypothetical protein AB0912_28515 [Streptomyces sp. NPDC007084]|uniref:hypothetical protein n=1 Tax=Streptomyces sp. NPDC007084 TaxID=3154313 RepID=UPI003454E26A
MTAESTVPSPGGQPREYGFSPVSVIPPRGADGGFRFPAGQRTTVRRAAWLPLVAVDAVAALATGQALMESRHPLFVVCLLFGVVVLNARAALYRPAPVPALLDELPALCARIAVTWCTLAALVAAFAPDAALSARTLALGWDRSRR